MVVRARLRVRVDGHGPGPELLRADAREVDGGRAVHAGGLRGVGVEGARWNDGHAGVLPGRVGGVGVRLAGVGRGGGGGMRVWC